MCQNSTQAADQRQPGYVSSPGGRWSLAAVVALVQVLDVEPWQRILAPRPAAPVLQASL